jgi:phosphoribosylaminoimidazole-succinocarboxamide synthase
MPDMPNDFVELVTNRYIELYEKITGETFVKADVTDIQTRIESNVNSFLQSV